jgi:cation diffusion facilitator CzcD-associated flavoprotein CzcO
MGASSPIGTGSDEVLDVVVVGAGFSGLYLLKMLRDLGLKVRVLEAGSDVGGTWYWNRYPGARCDSDSSVYCFSDRFSEQLLAEWEWSERFPSQPEIHAYLRWVADKLDLRRHIEFDAKVVDARYDERFQRWELCTASGEAVLARFFVPATGALSEPNIPHFPGLEDFRGDWYHTARLPDDLDVSGRRVVVVGNGATAVQIVPEVAKQAAEVWELVRHPYHCIPARNHRLDRDDWDDIHAHHREIWERARRNFIGFPYPDPLGPADAFTPAERWQILEDAWLRGGFLFGFSSFAVGDVLAREDLNELYLRFFAEKISEIVRDQEVARTLYPREPFGSKRPPLEHGYYAAFNRDNVHIHDMKRAPIQAITPRGVLTAEREIEADLILLATGFDAWSGTLMAMNIQGRDGRRLSEVWAGGPEDYLGMAVHGFPNMLMQYCGPYNPAALINAPTLIEQQGEWIARLIAHAFEHGIGEVEADKQAQDEFMALHDQVAALTLIPRTASWWTGTNVEGKPRRVLTWCGGFDQYQMLCDSAAQDGYRGFRLSPAPAA